jgi:hypothetical protein
MFIALVVELPKISSPEYIHHPFVSSYDVIAASFQGLLTIEQLFQSRSSKHSLLRLKLLQKSFRIIGCGTLSSISPPPSNLPGVTRDEPLLNLRPATRAPDQGY